MELSSSTLARLLAYWETSNDPHAQHILDTAYVSKTVLPLQRAFFRTHGWPYQCYLVNGQWVKVYGRALCMETLKKRNWHSLP
jgi:hypothetical protein